MKHLLLFTFGSIILFSCSSDESLQRSTEAPPPPIDSTAITYTGCYVMTMGKDSAMLQLHDSAGGYTGDLVYNRFEKDDNRGTVFFKQANNRLTGLYKFMSEGKESMQTVNFKMMSGELAEGYGELNFHGDTAVFRYPNNLQYLEEHPFRKVNCK